MDKIERAINKLIAPTLQTAGFELKKDWGGFFRFTEYGFDSFIVINKGRTEVNYFGIACGIMVRHDRIQKVFNTFGFIDGDEEQKQNSTFVLGYPYDERGLPNVYFNINPATMQADIEDIAQKLLQAFHDVAIPFYETYSNLVAIEEKLNINPLADIWPYTGGGMLEDRMVTSLLCAKAVNPDRYQLVREACLNVKGGMYPKEKHLEIVKKMDELQLKD